MDKGLKMRRPEEGFIDNLLMVHPTIDFLLKLPGGRVPDRTDFETYIDDNSTRRRRWKMAAQIFAPLGEEFLELVNSGKSKTPWN